MRGESLVDRKATERVHAGGKYIERVEDVPIWKRKGDEHDPAKYRATHYSAKY